jgi:uncharacterized protein YcbX
MRIHLGRIVVFPIKSLDGVAVEKAGITAGGILENDRTYSIVDAQGKYVNGKREPRVHRLRCEFDASFREVLVSERGSGSEARFILAEPGPFNDWLSAYFGFPVTLNREPEKGFPDDREAFGPTVVSLASLRVVASWFPDLTLEGARRRFRANLELDGEGMPPFWEDGLYRGPGECVPFQIGDVEFLAHNPCQRCAVPTRDPETGEVIPGFQKEFAERRRQTLPAWANSARFNHFYRFAVNTSTPESESGKQLRIGDAVVQPAGLDAR